MSDAHAVLDGLSHELALIVDRGGVLAWVDGRAERRGFAVGERLEARAVPGTEDKVRELLVRGASTRIVQWETALVLGDRPVTIVFSAAPVDNGVALVGSVVVQGYADSAAEGARAVNEIVDLNRELARKKSQLEESNRGIRALHAELAQHADQLRSSNEVKSRLVASVSHEFRTPLHSILGLSRLLLAESDGPLVGEQKLQVEFIRGSAEELSALVNDMLDLARLDAGAAPVRTDHFELRDMMSALRGTMAPLLPADKHLDLVFDPAPDVALEQDHAKLGQILRNLVSNALKFTEHGSVRVTARAEGEHVTFEVIDTGIGIAAADHEKVFQEFTQIDSALQRSVRGTGLGLPLSRKLAHALGGTLSLASSPGEGSTFTLRIPLEHADLAQFRRLEATARAADGSRAPVLVVEDDRSTVFAYERYLSMAGFQVVPARSTQQAREALKRTRPSAILLDVMLDGEDTWSFLSDLKNDPGTRDIPVLVCTVMNRESRARALGADEFWLKPVDQDKLISKLQQLATPGGGKVLVVDDDPQARYLVKKFLASTRFEVLEAADGKTGVAMAREGKPEIILLDFLLKNGTAFDVIDELKADPVTRRIPVIIVTSHALADEDRERLHQHAASIVPKEHLSRELAINRIRDALGRK